MAIAFVEHPVSKEEKLAYRKQGFDRVVDIRFAPEKLEEGDKTFEKKAEPAKSEAPKVGTVDWLRAQLTDKGIEFEANAKKSELEALLAEAED